MFGLNIFWGEFYGTGAIKVVREAQGEKTARVRHPSSREAGLHYASLFTYINLKSERWQVTKCEMH